MNTFVKAIGIVTICMVVGCAEEATLTGKWVGIDNPSISAEFKNDGTFTVYSGQYEISDVYNDRGDGSVQFSGKNLWRSARLDSGTLHFQNKDGTVIRLKRE